MAEHLLHRECPVCAAKDARAIAGFELSLYDNHPLGNHYGLVQCKDCGFNYCNTSMTQSDLDYYYENLSKYEDKKISTGGGYNKYDSDRLVVTAQYLSNHINPQDRILDIGCANGGLLKELKDLGFSHLFGADPSQPCVEATIEQVGCSCYQCSIFDLDSVVDEKFDLVILSHVLEHVLDVQQTIEIISKVLNTDGKLYVECPDASSYDKVIHAPYQEFNTEHINHFNLQSFDNLMLTGNFRRIDQGVKSMKIASGQDYFAAYGLFQIGDHSDFTLKFDHEVGPVLERYIAKSSEILDQIIGAIMDVDLPLAFIGVGQFAYKILPLVAIGSRDIHLFDNNPLNQNKQIDGRVIRPGHELAELVANEKVAVVITSPIHEESIKEGVIKSMNGLDNQPQFLGFSHLMKAL